ncbi:hypothetical protein ACHAWF_015657 [Thalassiosira exigua]
MGRGTGKKGPGGKAEKGGRRGGAGKHSQGGRRGGGGKHSPGGGAFPPHRRRKKVEISFDAADRRDYLTGFSSRKKERRAFGLAMQKVKDRKAKLEDRRDQREAKREEMEDIERNKAALREGGVDDGEEGGDASDDDASASGGDRHDGRESRTFRDERTTSQFGGTVSVTTTFGIPSDDDDDDVEARRDFYARETHGSNHVDEAQRAAGNVRSYIAKVKGTMGNKKKADGGGSGGRKGQHGASSMKGMGGGANLKMAKKTLAKFKAKGGKGAEERGSGGGRGKKRKGRR